MEAILRVYLVNGIGDLTHIGRFVGPQDFRQWVPESAPLAPDAIWWPLLLWPGHRPPSHLLAREFTTLHSAADPERVIGIITRGS